MTYKEALIIEMDELAKNPYVRFVGYNLAYGPKFNGPLINVPRDKIVETPVAENLMTGIAMGLALEGFLPVLCFERMDFCLAAADSLINHIGALQQYGMTLPMIIRVCVGHYKPLNPGEQHIQDYSHMFERNSMLIVRDFASDFEYEYPDIKEVVRPVMIYEYKALYNEEIK